MQSMERVGLEGKNLSLCLLLPTLKTLLMLKLHHTHSVSAPAYHLNSGINKEICE